MMDEVLTHLDASGRGAVGAVLRALVQGPSAAEAAPCGQGQLLLGGGAYETVLVILQDLAATELEESFDNIDTVLKDGDTARVVVDGL